MTIKNVKKQKFSLDLFVFFRELLLKGPVKPSKGLKYRIKHVSIYTLVTCSPYCNICAACLAQNQTNYQLIKECNDCKPRWDATSEQVFSTVLVCQTSLKTELSCNLINEYEKHWQTVRPYLNRSLSNITLTLFHIETPFNTCANRIDLDQAALVRAVWSESTLFAYGNMIRYGPTLVDLTV